MKIIIEIEPKELEQYLDAKTLKRAEVLSKMGIDGKYFETETDVLEEAMPSNGWVKHAIKQKIVHAVKYKVSGMYRYFVKNEAEIMDEEYKNGYETKDL